MINDSQGRTLIYDAFVKAGILTLVSTFYKTTDPPLNIVVGARSATEHGANEREPVRWFEVPVDGIPTTISIDGVTYPIKVSVHNPVVGGLAVATLFKDDHVFLPHMLAYYRRLGVTKFYLFYNGPALPAGLPTGADIEYGLWDFKYWNHSAKWAPSELGWGHAAQMTFLTMMRCRYLSDHSWMGFVDIDEFVYPENGASLLDVLELSPPDSVVVIQNYWAYLEKEGTAICNDWSINYGKRTKAFYRGGFGGMVGIHRPKESEDIGKQRSREAQRVHLTEELKLLHMINFGQAADRRSLVTVLRSQQQPGHRAKNLMAPGHRRLSLVR